MQSTSNSRYIHFTGGGGGSGKEKGKITLNCRKDCSVLNVTCINLAKGTDADEYMHLQG